MQDNSPSPQQPPSARIPEEKVIELDRANHQFHQARGHLETALDSYEPERERRLESVRKELHDAEHHLEEVTEDIQTGLENKPSSGG